MLHPGGAGFVAPPAPARPSDPACVYQVPRQFDGRGDQALAGREPVRLRELLQPWAESTGSSRTLFEPPRPFLSGALPQKIFPKGGQPPFESPVKLKTLNS